MGGIDGESGSDRVLDPLMCEIACEEEKLRSAGGRMIGEHFSGRNFRFHSLEIQRKTVGL
jgi:hypothetical protein